MLGATTADPGFVDAATRSSPGYLLCIDGGVSWTVPLPVRGELVAGRDPDCAIRLRDPLVSRRHAELLVVDGSIRVSDLGSRHGSMVNGAKLDRPRALLSGDVVTLGGAVLVVHRTARPATSRTLLDPGVLIDRLEVELARCLRYGRELSVVVARTALDRPLLAAVLAGELRPIDAAAQLSPGEVAILLAELDHDAALEAARRLSSALGAHAPAQVGVASSPRDGCDADSLIGGARAAAEAATPGGAPVGARHGAVELGVGGGRSILVAEPAMHRLYELIGRLAKSDLPILIQGETGAGKELAAAAVHHYSPRSGRPLVSINCAALPEQLAESELFGHERGAFTGALAARPGLIESASGGTIFLDEIAELSPAIQAKLLRVFETQRVTRIGEVREREIDVRLVAATHRDLEAAVAAGKFREDLLFRLSAARVVVPPLRDRPRELAPLAQRLLEAAAARIGRGPLALSTPALQALHLHGWRGNVRELRNAMAYAAAAAPEGATVVESWQLPEEITQRARAVREPPRAVSAPAPGPASFRPIGDEVAELERRRMVEALRATSGLQNRAADLIGMPLRTFVTKLRRYAIGPADWRGEP